MNNSNITYKYLNEFFGSSSQTDDSAKIEVLQRFVTNASDKLINLLNDHNNYLLSIQRSQYPTYILSMNKKFKLLDEGLLPSRNVLSALSILYDIKDVVDGFYLLGYITINKYTNRPDDVFATWENKNAALGFIRTKNTIYYTCYKIHSSKTDENGYTAHIDVDTSASKWNYIDVKDLEERSRSKLKSNTNLSKMMYNLNRKHSFIRQIKTKI